jgi:hypothetical protein
MVGGRPVFSRSRNLLFLVIALAWMLQGRVGAAQLCENACRSVSACTTQCYMTLQDVETGNTSTCGDYGRCYAQAVCGDGFCDEYSGETDTCANDCDLGMGTPAHINCPNGTCDPGETYHNCPADCSRPTPVQCGDGYCEPSEVSACDADCRNTEFCNNNDDCYSYYASGSFTCRAHRCVYDFDHGDWCNTDLQCPSGHCVPAGPTSIYGQWGFCVNII